MDRSHEKRCEWYDGVFLASCDSYLGEVEAIWAKNNYKREDQSCCCRPHIKHWEPDKIKLIYRDNDPQFGNAVIFPLDDMTRPSGPVDFGDSKFSHRLTHNEVQLLGQNRLINEIITKFNQGIKVIYLYGARNSGKTTIGQFLLNYIEARNNRVVPKIKNLADQCPRSDVWPLFTQMKRSCNDVTKEYYLLLDNTDKILEERWEAFHKELSEFIHKRNFYFIVTHSSDQLQSKLNSSLLHNKEVCIGVSAVSKRHAVNFVLKSKDRQQKFPLSKRNPDSLVAELEKESYYMQDVLALCNEIEKMTDATPNVNEQMKRIIENRPATGINQSSPTDITEELKECLK